MPEGKHTPQEVRKLASAMCGSAFVEALRADEADKNRAAAVSAFNLHKANLRERQRELDLACGAARLVSAGRQTHDVATTGAALAELSLINRGLSGSPSMGGE